MRAVPVVITLLALAGVDYLAQSTASASSSKTPPLFVYEEGGDTVSFFSPRTVRIVHAARGDAGVHSCQYDLPDNGNMYSGPEVESAFRDATVQAELRAHRTYLSPDGGSITAGADRAQWLVACYYGCTKEPAPMQQLHQVLHVVMRNARLVCP
jgi:hypothetical protein